AAGSKVQLLGVDANPRATSVADVLAYSRAHGMVNQWDFLTGPLAQLQAVWRAYHIAVQIQAGQIDHTPAPRHAGRTRVTGRTPGGRGPRSAGGRSLPAPPARAR
ncbi:MAG TPA: hypothetical protein VIX86_05315, partial [Streptosporangiaceae bacterium]